MKIEFSRIPLEQRTQEFTIEDVVKLSTEEFANFCNHMNEDYDFISKNSDKYRVDESGIARCLLVVGKGQEDGILVISEGYSYPRHTAYLPYAKAIVQQEKYPSLTKLNKNMVEAVDEQVEKALRYQKQGQYSFPESELYDKEPFNMDVFISMLAERPEINMSGQDDDIVRIVVAPKFAYEEDDSHLKVITQKEFELIYAKHLLWLDNGSGEQADFSNCLLRNLEMSDRWLENMIFDNAKIIDSRMNGANVNASSFKGTRIIKTECMEMTAIDSDFTGARFSNCDLSRADMTSSNLTKTAFWDCHFYNSVLRESCLEKTKFHRTDIEDCDTTDCVYDEQEWTEQKNGLKLGEM